MELLYIWVENYEDTFIEQGFNISTEYNITYKDGRLNISKNKNTVSIFPPIISSCKAIIGENGAGKTTFIRMMMEVINSSIQYLERILVFKDKNCIKVYHNLIDRNVDFSESGECIQVMDVDEYVNLEKDLELIHYSPTFHSNYKEFEGIGTVWKDISTDWLLREPYVKNTLSKPSYINLNYEDIFRIKSFIYDEDFNLETMKFKKPNELAFEVRDLIRTINIPSDVRRRSYNLLKDLEYCNGINRMVILSFTMLFMFNNYSKKRVIQDDYMNYFEEIISILEYFNSDKLNETEINLVAEKLKDINDTDLENESIEKFLRLLNDLEFEVHIDSNKKKLINRTFSASLKDDENLETILELYKSTFIQRITQVSWENDGGLSTGQESILIMYSRFYELFKTDLKKGKKSNIVILLDEPDIYFHPNWKRHLLNDFIKFIEGIIKHFKLSFKVQIFIATNEPYIISDLPKENIIFLDKSKSSDYTNDNDDFNKTFGANIHTLLTKTFFMDNTIGEFANENIRSTLKIMDKYKRFMKNQYDENLREDFKNEYIKYMNYEKNHSCELDINKMKEKVKYIISIIGEPLIKRKLEEIYRTAFFENSNDYELEILKLQREKEELKRMLKDKNLDKVDTIMELLEKRIEELKDKAGN